jgi:hypothetical protein
MAVRLLQAPTARANRALAPTAALVRSPLFRALTKQPLEAASRSRSKLPILRVSVPRAVAGRLRKSAPKCPYLPSLHGISREARNLFPQGSGRRHLSASARSYRSMGFARPRSKRGHITRPCSGLASLAAEGQIVMWPREGAEDPRPLGSCRRQTRTPIALSLQLPRLPDRPYASRNSLTTQPLDPSFRSRGLASQGRWLGSGGNQPRSVAAFHAGTASRAKREMFFHRVSGRATVIRIVGSYRPWGFAGPRSKRGHITRPCSGLASLAAEGQIVRRQSTHRA